MGTIFGVWPGDKLKGITGRDQAAAGMGVFGPRTVFVIALKDAPGCHEFLLQDDGKWLHVKETTQIGPPPLPRPPCSSHLSEGIQSTVRPFWMRLTCDLFTIMGACRLPVSYTLIPGFRQHAVTFHASRHLP